MRRLNRAVCAAFALAFLASTLLVSKPSSAAASDSGEIRIFVPSGIFGTTKWWVYIDRTLIATYRDRRKQGDGASFIFDRKTKDSYWLIDEDGWAMTSVDGIARKARAGFVDKYYDRTSIPMNAGQRVVGLVVFSERTPKLFLITSVAVELPASGSKTVQFGIPSGYTTFREIRAVAVSREPVDTELSSSAQALSRLSSAFSQDPRVSELLRASSQMRSAGIASSTVMMTMPQDYGGMREFDGEQVAAIVRAIKRDYEFEPHLSDEQAQAMSAAQNEIYSRLLRAATKHNLQIEQLQDLSRLLERNLP